MQDEPTPTRTVTDLNIPGRFAITVDGVFTPEECSRLISLSEKSSGYSPAMINVGYGQQELDTEHRKSDRWITDDQDLAATFFAKVRDYLPQTWKGRKLSCMNERLRFLSLRYTGGDYFKPHYDGLYTRPDGSETSYITIQIYLNDDVRGGETTFMPQFTSNKVVYPAPGRVLLFEHEILHEGSKVFSGTKYVIRSDIMYS